MAIPDYETIMLPLLKLLVDGKEHSLHELLQRLAADFQLTPQELQVMLPSGTKLLFYDRITWARTYLKKAGLLEPTRRAHIKITKRGLDVLSRNPAKLNDEYLTEFPEFLEFRNISRGSKQPANKTIPQFPELLDSIDHKMTDQDSIGDKHNGRVAEPRVEERLTPEEAFQRAYQEMKDTLAQELLIRVNACSPGFFERLVVQLLVKMGYGGSQKDAAQAIGKTGDEGIDGIIKQDPLGLDVVYIQAKRWDGVVGRPEIQRFVGALLGQRARKGVFITTSRFTNDAINYIKHLDTKVVLIDGEQLAQYMIDHGVGVSLAETYEVRKLDTDYFIDE